MAYRCAQVVGRCEAVFGPKLIDGDTRRRQCNGTADYGHSVLETMCSTNLRAIQIFVGLAVRAAQ